MNNFALNDNFERNFVKIKKNFQTKTQVPDLLHFQNEMVHLFFLKKQVFKKESINGVLKYELQL